MSTVTAVVAVLAVVDVVAAVLVLAGVGLAVVAGIGLVRFPDVFSRMHAATKPASLGLLLVVVGACLALDDAGDRAQLLLVVAFQLVTAPVAAHMVGRAAYRARAGAVDELVVDDLAGAQAAAEADESVEGRPEQG